MSSELSNALNPNVITNRRTRPAYTTIAENVSPPPPVEQTSMRPFVPHRSELELAITEPPPRPAAVQAGAGTAGSRQAHAVQELLRVLSSSKEAAALERKRRQAWEKAQEARFTERQAEMERQMLEMRQELSILKGQASLQPASPNTDSMPVASSVASPGRSHSPIPPSVQYLTIPRPSSTSMSLQGCPNSDPHAIYDLQSHESPFLPATSTSSSPLPNADVQTSMPSPPHSLLTPAHTPRLRVALPKPVTVGANAYSGPAFVQGSSSQPYTPPPTHPPRSPLANESETAETLPLLANTPLMQPSDIRNQPVSPMSALGKRHTPPLSDGDDSDSSCGEDGQPHIGDRRTKRRNGHDKRCLTVQHAMRAHILLLMQLIDDRALPDSHIEGEPLPADEPIRFIWEKTSKQSSHNAAMKRRVVVDLKANRTMYKHVPEKDFAKKHLENVFDQAFTTLRQKFKAQRDLAAASQMKKRDDQKTMRARRLSRKKIKLANRIESRKRLEMFTHHVFDGALQQDCMSSEESCEEDDSQGAGTGSQKILQIRGLSWRSLRLQRFYAILDEDDHADKGNKPKRGAGRKERRVGRDKDAQVLPPFDVAGWMISKRWVRLIQCTRPDLAPLVTSLANSPVDFDLNQCIVLGAESDDDQDLEEALRLNQYIPLSETSSLQHALTPIP